MKQLIIEFRKLIASILLLWLTSVLPECEFKREYHKFIATHSRKL